MITLKLIWKGFFIQNLIDSFLRQIELLNLIIIS
jgi:hypothetical protein